MRLVDHLYFVAEHDDHHLARIWNSLTSPGRRKQSVHNLVVTWACAGIANESPLNFSLPQLARELYVSGMESQRLAKERTWLQLNL
jgi:hypothetical protein